MQDNRVGGRLKDAKIAGATVELSWQWIIGSAIDPTNMEDPFNVVLALAKQCGLKFREDPTPSRGMVIYDQNGVDITKKVLPLVPKYRKAVEGIFALNAKLNQEDPEGLHDVSVELALRLNGWEPRTPEEQAVEYMFFDFGCGQPSSGSSARRYFRIPGAGKYNPYQVTDERGFSHIVRCLADSFLSPSDSRLHLNTVVKAIIWSDDCVCVTVSENGKSRQYCAPHAILTFSVGSLQVGTVKFDPELPPSKVYAVNHLSMARFMKIYVAFNDTFWDDEVDVIAVVNDYRGREYYPFFIPIGSFLPGKPPILEALLTGETALRVGLQDKEVTKQQIVEVLRGVYGDCVTEPVDIVCNDLAGNPFFYGDFVTYNVGINENTYDEVGATLGGLHFSGEGVFANYPRTVQAAYWSGKNSANDILQGREKHVKKSSKEEKKEVPADSLSPALWTLILGLVSTCVLYALYKIC